jgi:predicted XRE-type DNA-binding protein
MPSARRSTKPEHVTTGDIFDDLSLSPQEALEAKIKSDIWRDLTTHIHARALDQTSLQKVLKIHQPDVSNLLRGKISKFSTSKLLTFAIRLDLDVRVQLTAPKAARQRPPATEAGKSGRSRSPHREPANA